MPDRNVVVLSPRPYVVRHGHRVVGPIRHIDTIEATLNTSPLKLVRGKPPRTNPGLKILLGLTTLNHEGQHPINGNTVYSVMYPVELNWSSAVGAFLTGQSAVKLNLGTAVTAVNLLEVTGRGRTSLTNLGQTVEGRPEILFIDPSSFSNLQFPRMPTKRALEALSIDRKLKVRTASTTREHSGCRLLLLSFRPDVFSGWWWWRRDISHGDSFPFQR
jgi:hypothetical protein